MNNLPIYIVTVSTGFALILSALAIATFVGISWALLLIVWHIRHDPDGSRTYARYIAKKTNGGIVYGQA